MSNLEKNPKPRYMTKSGCTDFTVFDAANLKLLDRHMIPFRRALPHDDFGMIGPWCFVDHFGPQGVEPGTGISVAHHPHVGMATISMLFCGELERTNSDGEITTVKPGESQLFIAGRGACHAETTSEDTDILHGVELWYALPDKHRFTPPSEQHCVAECFYAGDCKVTVYLGKLGDVRSPIDPIVSAVAAQLDIYGKSTIELDPVYEHGLLLDSGEAEIILQDGTSQLITADQLAFLPQGTTSVSLSAEVPARLVLFGGRPFDEEILLWWNFVGRSREELERWCEDFRADISEDPDHEQVFARFTEGEAKSVALPPLPEED